MISEVSRPALWQPGSVKRIIRRNMHAIGRHRRAAGNECFPMSRQSLILKLPTGRTSQLNPKIGFSIPSDPIVRLAPLLSSSGIECGPAVWYRSMAKIIPHCCHPGYEPGISGRRLAVPLPKKSFSLVLPLLPKLRRNEVRGSQFGCGSLASFSRGKPAYCSLSASAGRGGRRKTECGELQGSLYHVQGEPFIPREDLLHGMTVHEISQDGRERNASSAKNPNAAGFRSCDLHRRTL